MASFLNKLRLQCNFIPQKALFSYQFCPSTTVSGFNDLNSTKEFPISSINFQYPVCLKSRDRTTTPNTGLAIPSGHVHTRISTVDLLGNSIEDRLLDQTYPSRIIVKAIPHSRNIYQYSFLNDSLLSNGVTTFNSAVSKQLLSCSELKKNNLCYSSEGNNPRKITDFGGKPTEEQLTKVLSGLSECLPKFFVDVHNFSLYNTNIVFENKIRNVTIKGLVGYVQHLSVIKIMSHLRYSRVKFRVLKITQHTDDGTVRVRWRIAGVSGMRSLFMFWKFRLWDWKNFVVKETEWVDGFSIFYIGSDGLIYKHICDKMMPDENREPAASPVGLKLALLLGLAPEAADVTQSTIFTSPANCN